MNYLEIQEIKHHWQTLPHGGYDDPDQERQEVLSLVEQIEDLLITMEQLTGDFDDAYTTYQTVRRRWQEYLETQERS